MLLDLHISQLNSQAKKQGNDHNNIIILPRISKPVKNKSYLSNAMSIIFVAAKIGIELGFDIFGQKWNGHRRINQ